MLLGKCVISGCFLEKVEKTVIIETNFKNENLSSCFKAYYIVQEIYFYHDKIKKRIKLGEIV